MHTDTRSRTCQRGLSFAAPLIALLISGCGPIAPPTYFVPPTMDSGAVEATRGTAASSATPRIEPSAPPTLPPPSPTPACSDDLDYLQDLTIPDGSLIAPGDRVDKRWQVRNSGSCNWDQRYSLRLISGDDLGAGASIVLYPARAGSEATLQVLFTAPQEPGTYACQWQAANPDGTPFGDAFYMQIIVAS